MAITKINNLGITDSTIVNADISASAAIASTKLSGVNDAKAWVNFNGTGTVAIRASFNVTSITDNGTGNYTVNFTTTLVDANYAVLISGSSPANAPSYFIGGQTTSGCTIRLFNIAGGGSITDADAGDICASIFR